MKASYGFLLLVPESVSQMVYFILYATQFSVPMSFPYSFPLSYPLMYVPSFQSTYTNNLRMTSLWPHIVIICSLATV